MLLQSHRRGVIYLLPALPEAWRSGAVEAGRGEDQEGGGGTGPWKEGGKDQDGRRARTDRRSRGGDRRDSQQRISCPNRESLVKSNAPWT